ncbi:MAG: hypothetical protein AAFX44_06140 [Pseudomonadota bacterium]
MRARNDGNPNRAIGRPAPIRTTFIATAVVALATVSFSTAHATEFESGHGALQVFDADGMASMPLWVKVWLAIMLGTFASGLLFVWRQPLARWAVGGILTSFFVTPWIFRALELPYLSGAIAIGHIVFWTPALLLLLLRRPFSNAREGRWFRAWSGAMTAVILFSFVFDIRDAAIYIEHFAG